MKQMKQIEFNSMRLLAGTAFLALGIFVMAGSRAVAQEPSEQIGEQEPVAVHVHPTMQMDDAARRQMEDEIRNQPESYIDASIVPPAKMKPSLLDLIPYNPAERNQGNCGDCYVWTATALLEALHNQLYGVSDRLSVQWFNSNLFGYYPPGSKTSFKNACGGGNIGGVLQVYYEKKMPFVPWSNKNAQFQDGKYNDPNNTSPPAVKASAITNSPSYTGDANAIQDVTIATTNVSQAKAISNIKNVLLQGKPVAFDIMMSGDKGEGWDGFNAFWDNKGESAIWSPDSACNETQSKMEGHYVTIVGYDASDSNPANHYWLVLNSWGTEPLRPNGLFRMSMNMNYNNCAEARYFENLQVASGKQAFHNTNATYTAVDSSINAEIDLKKFDWNTDTSSSWSTIDKTIGTTPVLITYNTLQYLVVRDETDNNLWMSSMGTIGSWSSWSQISGTTDGTPALVVYHNNLYLFVKTAGGSSIQYKYMNDKRIWSNWMTVPGAGTGHSPAVAAYNGQIQLFQTGISGTVEMNSMNGDGTWTGWLNLNWNNVVTDAAPTVTYWNQGLYVAVKVKTAQTIEYAYTTGDPIGATWAVWTAVPGSAHTAGGPTISAESPASLCFQITGQTSKTLYQQCELLMGGPTSMWSGWLPYSGVTSSAPPSVNNYWFP